MTKSFIWNAIGTTLNSFLSLFLLIIVTRCNGIELSGTFSYLFTISLILQVVSNFGGRVYQVTDVKGEFSFNEYMSSRLYTIFITIALYAIVCVINNFDTNTMLIGLILVFLRIVETISDVIYGQLQKNEKLEFVGKSLVFKSVFILVVFSVVNIITKNLLYSAIGLFLSSMVVFFMYDLSKVNKFSFDFKFDVYRKSFFIFISNFITLFTLNIPRFTAEYTLNKEELGYLGILLMIPTVVGLICQFLLQPQLVTLSNNYKKMEINKLKHNYRKINLLIFGFSIFCIICAIFLGDPVLSLLYGISFKKYKFGFCLLILSGTFNGISVVYSNVLTIMRKTKVQLIPFIISLILSPIIVYYLSIIYGLYGVFYSLLIIMFIQNIIFIVLNNIYFKKLIK